MQNPITPPPPPHHPENIIHDIFMTGELMHLKPERGHRVERWSYTYTYTGK